MIKIINLRTVDIESWIKNPNHLYIGRKRTLPALTLPASKWQNPYKITPIGGRKEAVKKFEKYINKKTDLLQCIGELRGKTLGCWCHPKLCHGNILKIIALKMDPSPSVCTSTTTVTSSLVINPNISVTTVTSSTHVVPSVVPTVLESSRKEWRKSNPAVTRSHLRRAKYYQN